MTEAAAQTPTTPTLDPALAQTMAEVFDDPASAAAETPATDPSEQSSETAQKGDEGTAAGDDADKAKTPATDKEKSIAQRLAIATKAEQRAAASRSALKTQQADIERAKADLEARERNIKLIEEDPVRYFELSKADPKAFLEKLAGIHKPEAVQEKKLSAVEQELKDVKDRLAAKEAAEARQAETQKLSESEKAAGEAFIAHVGEAADRFPHITQEWSEAEAVAEAFKSLHEVVGHTRDGKPVTRLQAYKLEHGVYPDNDIIAEHLEGIAKSRIEGRTKSAWGKRGDAPNQASKAAPGEAPKVPPANGTRPRTLSRADTSQRAAAPRAAWSQDQADEESLRIIEAALKKG